MLGQRRESSAHHSRVCSVARVREQPGHLATRYREVRNLTEALARPLSAEDQTIQSMPEASPTKWHRAHATWFFETFVLVPHATSYHTVDGACAGSSRPCGLRRIDDRTRLHQIHGKRRDR